MYLFVKEGYIILETSPILMECQPCWAGATISRFKFTDADIKHARIESLVGYINARGSPRRGTDVWRGGHPGHPFGPRSELLPSGCVSLSKRRLWELSANEEAAFRSATMHFKDVFRVYIETGPPVHEYRFILFKLTPPPPTTKKNETSLIARHTGDATAP